MRKVTLLFLTFYPFLLFGQKFDPAVVKTADSLLQVAANLLEEGANEQALDICMSAENLAVEKLNKQSETYGAACQLHNQILQEQGNFPEAEKWLLEALSVREKVPGKETSAYASSLGSLAKLYWLTGDYDRSEPAFIETLAILEKVMGKESTGYTHCLNNLANLYADMGNYEAAESGYLRAREIDVKISGKTNPDYLGELVNLGNLYVELGDYETAESLFLEAKKIFEVDLNDREHPFYINCINGLAILYAAVGNFEKAENFALQANALWGKMVGEDTPDYAIGLLNLASLYSEMGQSDKAEPIYQEALTLYEKTTGKENPDYAMCLSNLASLHFDTGRYEKAEPLYLEALALREKVQGREHPDYAFNLFNLGALYDEKGDLKKAESLYLESKVIYEKVMGKNHPDYTLMLHNLGTLYYAMGDFEQAKNLLSEHAALHRAHIAGATNYLSEQELNNYLQQYAGKGQAQMLSIAQTQANKRPGINGICYDNSLFYKGYLLMSAGQIKRLALSSTISAEQFSLLKSYERRLASEYALPLAERTKVDELELKANDLEKQLARTVAGYGAAVQQVNWQEVQKALKPGEAAVEFVRFSFSGRKAVTNTSNKSDSSMYAALLLLPDGKEPRFIPLFEEKQLNSLLLKPGRNKQEQINTLYQGGNAPSLYSLIWSPLEPQLGGVKTVYFSPAGLLHRLNPGAFSVPGKTDHSSLADRYQLVELGSTRQLVQASPQKPAATTALLWGGIQYDLDTTALVNRFQDTAGLKTRGGPVFPGADSSFSVPKWGYLKWTEIEVNAIEGLLSDAGIKAVVQNGSSATEENFKTIGKTGPSPRILHMATHGYFFPDPEKAKGNDQAPGFKISEHPMIRSGLILAGGNYAWSQKNGSKPFHPNMEDGILTAYEISQMNLSNTELVVLSACETGLGDIKGNEGVYGLQRAFKIAGARYLIMSLWQVPDFQTQELMTTFYSHWIEDKMSIPEAFRAAQNTMRSKYKEPFLWAGFILVE